MDDPFIPDENEQPSAPAPQAPVIPAPRRPAPSGEPAAGAPGEEAAVPAEPAPEPAEAVAAPEAAEPQPAEPELAEVEPAVAEVVEPAPEAEAAPEGEPAAPEPAPPEGEPTPEAEAAEVAPEGEDSSLEAMVADLREGEETAEQPEGEGEPVEGEAPAGEVEAAAEAAPVEGVIIEAAEDTRALRRRSAKIPFWVYLGVWLIFAGVQTYLMWPLAAKPFTGQPLYGLLVLIAAGLVCAGLILGLCVWWFVSAHSESADRGGLVRAMLLRTAASMTGGVVIWWIALLVLDLRRLGMLG